VSTLAECLRALAARGCTDVADPLDDTMSISLEEAMDRAGRYVGNDYQLDGEDVVRVWSDGVSEPYWRALPAPSPAWVPTFWERLLLEEPLP
jgi:hypothetical protein